MSSLIKGQGGIWNLRLSSESHNILKISTQRKIQDVLFWPTQHAAGCKASSAWCNDFCIPVTRTEWNLSDSQGIFLSIIPNRPFPVVKNNQHCQKQLTQQHSQLIWPDMFIYTHGPIFLPLTIFAALWKIMHALFDSFILTDKFLNEISLIHLNLCANWLN